MDLHTHLIADSEVIGISPLEQVFVGEIHRDVKLRFHIYTKQIIIPIESKPIHYTDSIDENNEEYKHFHIVYRQFRLRVKAILATLPNILHQQNLETSQA